jgi:hypothetical protein
MPIMADFGRQARCVVGMSVHDISIDAGFGAIVDGECDRLVASLSFAKPIAGIGRWECDLVDDRLTWPSAIHDLFGLPRSVLPLRTDVLRRFHSAALLTGHPSEMVRAERDQQDDGDRYPDHVEKYRSHLSLRFNIDRS